MKTWLSILNKKFRWLILDVVMHRTNIRVNNNNNNNRAREENIILISEVWKDNVCKE